jgi:hypothetical protein
VADVCLKQDPLDNRAVPTSRFKKLWGMVSGGAAWNQRYFKIVRDRLDRMGVIRIFDRNHCSGKAWRWSVGPEFPPRVVFSLGLITTLVRNYQVHNTLYQMAGQILRLCDRKSDIRPPPARGSPPNAADDHQYGP